jgi:O-acetyl-ADP-ribose deacetylase (regulator of RNase III)
MDTSASLGERRQSTVHPQRTAVDEQSWRCPPANGNRRPADQQQQLERDAAGQAAGGHPRTASPQYPAGLLDTPVSALIGEIMYWRELDARCESRFDEIKNRLQDVMTRRPPPRPQHLRRAKITEVRNGNLFDDAPQGAALAHCVGADFVMGAGLAVEFRERFGHVEELRAGNHRPGTVAAVPLLQPGSNNVDRYIFHLVTKPTSRYCLPRWWELIYAVRELARLCKELKVKTVAMPQIGAGLDRQQWWKVRRVIEIEFAGADTEVLVFFHPSEHPVNECSKTWTAPPQTQLVDFIDPLLPRTTPTNRLYSHALQTPPFSTPDSATPCETSPAAEDSRSCSLPDGGVPSAATVGPCAAKVMSDKREDVDHASRREVDSIKTLITAQGPDRSVHNSINTSTTTTPTNRLLNDLQKSNRRGRRSSSIPRPITPNNLPNIETQTIDTDNLSAPDMCSHSDPQNQRQPPNDEEAGRNPAVSLLQRSSGSHPAESHAGVAQNPGGLNPARAPIVYGGHRPYKARLKTSSLAPFLSSTAGNAERRYPKTHN